MSLKNFIITGATSMIGIALCKIISTDLNCHVYAICQKNSKGLKLIPQTNNITLIFTDLQNINSILKFIDKADVFIHLAWAHTDHNGRNNKFQQELNVTYSLDSIRIASKLNCNLFVEAGSQAEYGIVDGKITEQTTCSPITEYGKAKLEVFNEGSKLAESLGLKYLHLRIFSVFGENDRPWTLIMTIIDKMLNNEPIELTSCQQKWNFLYSMDCAKQIFYLSKFVHCNSDFKNEIYNIASKDTRQLWEFIEEVKSILHSNSDLIYGSIIPPYIVSLDPDVNKTEQTIGFISDFTFNVAINNIVKNKHNLQL